VRALALFVLLGLAACVALAAAAQPADLASARNLWRRAALTDYEYGYRKYCECHPDTPPETIVSVRGGAVVRVRHRPTDSTNEVPAKAGSEHYYWTIDDLFALIESAKARGAAVRATYDAERGFPTEIHIDYDKNAIGDELDLVLTTVSPLTR
jgi:hypothetical protein